MNTPRIYLSLCAVAALALTCSSGFAQQVDVAKQRHTAALEMHPALYGSRASGDLYSSMIAKYLHDPSHFDFLAARWGGAGFSAPRSQGNMRFAAARFAGRTNTIEIPSTLEGAWAPQNASMPDLFGSFGFQPANSFGTFAAADTLAPVPEPSTWFGAALAVALIAYSQRRRLLGLLRA